MSVKDCRKKIDAVDKKLLALLNTRATLAQKIGEVKKAKSLEVFDSAREDQILARIAKQNPGPFPEDSLRAIYREIFAASHQLEEPISVAYLGPRATFTHQACRQVFGASTRCLPAKSIRDVFAAVEREEATYGVVPIENSTEGIINHTLDMFLESSLKIAGEAVLVVSHHLLSLTGKMRDIRVIYSHSQALAQCQEWIQEHFPDVPLREASSTAEAARLAAKDPQGAAIASRLSEELYGLRAVRRKIEDRLDNVTRFLIISRVGHAPTGHDKTSIMFSVKDRVGALHDMLQPFARERINLTKIESRPTRRKAWDYVFFVDFEGHMNDTGVRKVLRQIRRDCTMLKVLGSYPLNDKVIDR